jgi:raffinose/stachyose/melibiose transport system substrate-binding protein
MRTVVPKWLSAGAAITLLAAAGGVSSGAVAVAQSPAASAWPDLTGVTLQIWYPTTMADAHVKLLDAFEAATGVKFDRVVIPDPEETNVQAKWNGGARPDLMYYHPDSTYVGKLGGPSNFVDLSSLGFFDRYAYDAIKSNYTTPDGATSVWGATIDYPSFGGWFYNKDVFTKYGLKPPTTLAELETLCATLKTASPTTTCIEQAGGTDSWALQLIPLNLMSDVPRSRSITTKAQIDAVFDNPIFTDSFAEMAKLQAAGAFNSDIATATYVDQQNTLVRGDAAIVPQGSWFVGDMGQGYGFDVVDKRIGFFGLSDQGQRLWTSLDHGYLVPKTGDATKEAAAQEFIKYITSADGQGVFLPLEAAPSVFTDIPSPSNISQTIQDIAAAGQKSSIPASIGFVVGLDNLPTDLSRMVAGEIDAKQVVDSLRQDVYKGTSSATGVPIQ